MKKFTVLFDGRAINIEADHWCEMADEHYKYAPRIYFTIGDSFPYSNNKIVASFPSERTAFIEEK